MMLPLLDAAKPARLPLAFRSLTLILCMFTAPSTLAMLNYQGLARDLDSDDLFYREVHCVVAQDNTSTETVRYLGTTNNPIATKRLREGLTLLPQQPASPASTTPRGIRPAWVPEYEFIHHDTGFAEGLRYQGDAVVLYRREGNDADWEQKRLDLKQASKPVIADAGFDQFIRDHLSKLATGESLDVVYLSAPRLTTLDFTLEPGEQQDDRLTITMYPSNFVIRLLVEPLLVTYSSKTGRLLNFRGLTNVPQNTAENYLASIEYQYGEELDAFCQ